MQHFSFSWVGLAVLSLLSRVGCTVLVEQKGYKYMKYSIAGVRTEEKTSLSIDNNVVETGDPSLCARRGRQEQLQLADGNRSCSALIMIGTLLMNRHAFLAN